MLANMLKRGHAADAGNGINDLEAAGQNRIGVDDRHCMGFEGAGGTNSAGNLHADQLLDAWERCGSQLVFKGDFGGHDAITGADDFTQVFKGLR